MGSGVVRRGSGWSGGEGFADFLGECLRVGSGRKAADGFGSDSSRPGDVAVMSQREVYFFSEDDGGPLYGEDVLWESDSRTVGCFNKSPGGFATVWVFMINAESTQYLM